MIIIDDDGVMHKVLPMDTLDKIKADIELLKADGLANMDAVLRVIERYRNEVSS